MITSVGFDIDGVITDGNSDPWELQLVKYFDLEHKQGMINTSDMTDLMAKYNLTEEEMLEFFHNNSHKVFPKIQPRKDASRNLKLISKLGLDIYLITARTEAEETYNWLDKNNMTYDKLIHNHKKHEVCSDLEVPIYIEDSPKKANKVSKNCSGTRVFLMKNVYNQNDDLENDITVINNLTEFRYYIKTIIGIQRSAKKLIK